MFFFGFHAFLIGCTPTGTLQRSELVRGTWSGTVFEGDLTYHLQLHIDRLAPGRPAGTATYSGALNCVGTLTFEGVRNGVYVFYEPIDDINECADGGQIRSQLNEDGTLLWEWFVTHSDSLIEPSPQWLC